MTSQLRIYLAWQRIADGRTQIRRWSPDRFANAAQNKYMFLGFESQSTQALAWLAANGEPTYPECFSAALPAEPYIISSGDSGFEAWKPKQFEHTPLEHDAGVMRTLKLSTRGEK